MKRAAEEHQRSGDRGSDPLRAVEHDRSRNEFPEHDVEIRRRDECQHDRHARRDDRVQQSPEGRLSERAQRDSQRADADLHGADQHHRLLEQRHGDRGATIARVGEFNEPPAAGGDKRILGQHEERVAGDQREYERDSPSGGHAIDGGLLPSVRDRDQLPNPSPGPERMVT